MAEKDDDLGFEPLSKEEQAQEISKLESFGKGVQQGTTLGFADELGAIAGALGAGAGGDTSPFSERYTNIRDLLRKEYKVAAEANPKTSFAGNILGGAITAPIVPNPTGILQSGGLGALIAGTAGLGTSEADLTKGEVLPAAIDVAKSAPLGFGLGAGIASVGPGIRALAQTQPARKVAQTLQSKGGELIESAVGAAPTITKAELAGSKVAGEAGKEALEKELINPFSLKKTVKNLKKGAEETTEGFDPFTKKTTLEKPGTNLETLAKESENTLLRNLKRRVTPTEVAASVGPLAFGRPESAIAIGGKLALEKATGYTLPQFLSGVGGKGLFKAGQTLANLGSEEAQFFGNALIKAATKDSQAQKATIFALSQNPSFRAIFNDSNNVNTILNDTAENANSSTQYTPASTEANEEDLGFESEE